VALTEGWPDPAWYGAHALYLWSPATGKTRRVVAVEGAQVPNWSADGRHLLYVRDDGLWLASAGGGPPVRIAYPLFQPRSLYSSFTNDYYGEIAWTDQFAWWSPGHD
jgi:hypothetical protein